MKMILTDSEVLEEMKQGHIVIDPFRRECLGTNSYDIHLGNILATYNDRELDVRKHNQISYFEIPEEGYVLQQSEFYLGVTEEYTETHTHVPFLEGKSSIGRLGIDIHATAGKGDIGFSNHWTLEISVKKPVRIYRKMPIGQLIYFKVNGQVLTPYNKKSSAKYTKRLNIPMESQMWKNFSSQ